jgi:hypothetical protein
VVFPHFDRHLEWAIDPAGSFGSVVSDHLAR